MLQLLHVIDIGSDYTVKKETCVGQIQRYIEVHIEKDVSLSSISAHVRMHPVRMRKAKQLLQETDLRVYEVSEKVGYLSATHFIREFKKYYGLPPHSFRERTSDKS